MTHRTPTSFAELEAALDSGTLYVAMNSGKWWLTRRNGMTKRWKREPSRFYLPTKFGFRGTGAITETTTLSNFRIADSREAAENVKSRPLDKLTLFHEA